MDKKINKKVLAVVILAIVLIGSVIGVFAKINYDEKQEQIRLEKIETKNSELDSKYKEFEKEEDREVKLTLYKSFEEEKDKYSKNEEFFEECEKNYNSYLKKMKENLVGYYPDKMKEYSESISSDLETVNDKDKLNELINSFSSLKEQIASESKNYNLLNEEDLNSYNEEIDNLISSYQDKIAAIEKAEREAEKAARKKAEEEVAKKKAEEEKKKKEQSSKKNNSSKNNSSNSSNNNNSNSGDKYSYDKKTVWTFENGEQAIYYEKDGRVYDENWHDITNWFE